MKKKVNNKKTKKTFEIVKNKYFIGEVLYAEGKKLVIVGCYNPQDDNPIAYEVQNIKTKDQCGLLEADIYRTRKESKAAFEAKVKESDLKVLTALIEKYPYYAEHKVYLDEEKK